MKKGDIIKNNWASDENPTQIFIYIGTTGKFGNGVYLKGNGWGKVRFFTSDLKEHPGIYEVIGHSEGWELMKKELREVTK